MKKRKTFLHRMYIRVKAFFRQLAQLRQDREDFFNEHPNMRPIKDVYE